MRQHCNTNDILDILGDDELLIIMGMLREKDMINFKNVCKRLKNCAERSSMITNVAIWTPFFRRFKISKVHLNIPIITHTIEWAYRTISEIKERVKFITDIKEITEGPLEGINKLERMAITKPQPTKEQVLYFGEVLATRLMTIHVALRNMCNKYNKEHRQWICEQHEDTCCDKQPSDANILLCAWEDAIYNYWKVTMSCQKPGMVAAIMMSEKAGIRRILSNNLQKARDRPDSDVYVTWLEERLYVKQSDFVSKISEHLEWPPDLPEYYREAIEHFSVN